MWRQFHVKSAVLAPLCPLRIAVCRFAIDMLRNVDFTRWSDVLPPLTRKSLLYCNMLQRRHAAIQVAPERRLAIDLQFFLFCFHVLSFKDTMPLYGAYYTKISLRCGGRFSKKFTDSVRQFQRFPFGNFNAAPGGTGSAPCGPSGSLRSGNPTPAARAHPWGMQPNTSLFGFAPSCRRIGS